MTLLTDDPWDTRDSFVLRHFAQGLPRLRGRKTIAIRNSRTGEPVRNYSIEGLKEKEAANLMRVMTCSSYALPAADRLAARHPSWTSRAALYSENPCQIKFHPLSQTGIGHFAHNDEYNP